MAIGKSNGWQDFNLAVKNERPAIENGYTRKMFQNPPGFGLKDS